MNFNFTPTQKTIFISDLIKLIESDDLVNMPELIFKGAEDYKITLKQVDDYADYLADYYFFKGYLTHFAHKATMQKETIVQLSKDTQEIISKFYALKGYIKWTKNF